MSPDVELLIWYARQSEWLYSSYDNNEKVTWIIISISLRGILYVLRICLES